MAVSLQPHFFLAHAPCVYYVSAVSVLSYTIFHDLLIKRVIIFSVGIVKLENKLSSIKDRSQTDRVTITANSIS